jgi:hypothetical protein
MGIMSTRIALARRLTGVAGLVAGLLSLGSVTPALAQVAGTDPRWQAWLGCWEVAVPESIQTIATLKSPRICVIPASGASAVDIVTVVGDSVASRQHIEASGAKRDVTRDGCTGWESAQWSSNGQRVYTRASYTCGAGLTRLTSGVIAMSATGEWLDVQEVAVGTSVGVRAARYHDATSAAPLPTEVAAALRGVSLSMNMPRIAAAAPITTADVVEASRLVDAGVVETWLAERGQGFGLDARQLIELEKLAVPSTVIDVMVALSYPSVFALDRSRLGETRAAADTRENPDHRVIYAGTMYDVGYSPYGYSPYDYRYGYGYGFGFGYGWYPGRPIVIVQKPPTDGTTEPARHGKVVKGRGYTADGSPSGSTDSGSRPRSGSGSGSASTGQSGSSGASSTSSGGSSSDKGSSSGRTAKPRPPK